MSEVVACSPRVLDAIASHARGEARQECCGLLIGTADRIDEAVALANRAADPVKRYEIDPRDYLALIKRCRGTPQTVIGAYHSHVNSAPEPSETDRAEAASHFLYLIAGPVAGNLPLRIRAFRLVDGNFRPIGLVPDAEESQT